MARRSQCSSAGDNPLDPNYLPPHYREEYRLAIDALVEEDLEGYYKFLQSADVVDFLCTPEIQHIQSSIHVPQQSAHHPEQRFLEVGADGSSDTYWPLHSDLDAPGLDLGWPQLHHFIGPTEVTTLVNPPEPDMPSIKDQARRLIKNAQQVIAIAMDMFTDVDMFADILNAAMRNVAVYVVLDEQNVHHFVDMVSNCRVNLQSIQFLRVRTVQGITYQCRSGKSFKGQMMDRFLLTDCRAVLSGNYSFMWSYEKLHRCMAHLFLGQLVSTFDEEFRILYAQSQPLVMENMLGPMEDLGNPQKRPYQSMRTPHYREQKKLVDAGHPEDWARPSYDEGDRRMMPFKRQDQTRGPTNIYSRFPSQQMRMDAPFDQGVSKPGMMENPAFKRHSLTEAVPGRYTSQFLQPHGMPEPEPPGRHFPRGQQPYAGPGREPEYSSYDKFWNQDCLSTDQYPEPGPPQGMDSPDGFDPVLNYLSSSRPQDFDQGSGKVPGPDLPFGSPHPRRQSLGQPYACQTSPTPSSTTEQKLYFPDANPDRKDPAVKRGLRNWRISSYLSAYENPDDEGLPMATPQTSDPFEEPSTPTQQTTSAVDLSLPKIPNVREFKVPAVPRVSHMPGYAKTMAREQPKKVPDEPADVVADAKTTPTPSDCSSTAEGEKTEEAEQKEPRASLRRDDPFRRKFNAAQPRSSRLRSSLIFTSLDQQNTLEDGKAEPQDEGSDKGESEQTKLPFLSHLLGSKRAAREPIKWSQFIKSATIDHSGEASKPGEGEDKADDKDGKDAAKKDAAENPEAQESSKQTKAAPSAPQSKQPEADQASSNPSVTPPLFIDMNDPDARLMFFKEMAAKRKAAKAAEAEEAKKSKDKAAVEKPPAEPKDGAAVKKEEPVPKQSTEKTVPTPEGSSQKGAEKSSTLNKQESLPKGSAEGSSEKLDPAEKAGKTAAPDALKSVQPPSDASDQATSAGSCASDASKSIEVEQTEVSADSGATQSESSASLPPDKETAQSKSMGGRQSDRAVKESEPCPPPTQANSTPATVSALTQGTDQSESPRVDSTSAECHSVTPSSEKESSSSTMNSDPPQSAPTQADVAPPPLQSEQEAVSDASSSSTAVQSSSSDHATSTQPSPKEPVSSKKTPKPSSLSPAYSLYLSDVAAAKTQASTESAEETSPESLTTPTPDTEKGVSESEQTAPKADKDKSEVDKTDSESGKDVSQSENLVAGSEKVVSSTSKDVLESEKEKNPSPSICPETQSVPGSDQGVSDPAEDVSKTEIPSDQSPDVSGSSEDITADGVSPGLSPAVCDSGLLAVENSASKSDSNEPSAPAPTPVTPQAEPSATKSSVKPDTTPSETTASSQDASKQTPPPSDLSVPAFDTPISSETVSSSPPPPESDPSPEAKATERNTPAVHGGSGAEALHNETATAPDKASQHETNLSSPTEPTSNVPTDVLPPCDTPEPVTSESNPKDSGVAAADSNAEPELLDTDEQKSGDTKSASKVGEDGTQDSAGDKANDQVKPNAEPAEAPAKQPKANQVRYHSSTANVLSSSNLRDDTKLLLEQISANSQTRGEPAKEAAVTDDEKEDEADKNAKRELERGIRTLGKGLPKPAPEREKLLERIQCMRKERKVYSRFEV